ncbi:anti-sigma factor family protein [Arthrobacter sp. 131MFCol6.1]|uniref:anti-sigma factor family protein n=1 Tax=Arthrobacter sp. 131MFCol6.1 TaxID=1157944 RepID=UPI00037F1F4F|nr:zf-HC2 domain-containing protein [Arthrobacter sp. 131MFCol6.1]
MNQNGIDDYRRWDAAYVLGSLVSSERHEFEEHLSGCAGCRAAVAELAGLPSLLAALSPEEAQSLGRTDGERPTPKLQPGLANKVQRGRRRTRLAAAGIMLGAAAAAGAVYVQVAGSPPPAAQIQAASATVLNFTPVAGGALAATGTLTTQPWGTQIDWKCTYTPSPADYASPGPGTPEEYRLVVVDSRGATTQVATWTATPGTVATPTATTVVPTADIRSVEIRAVASGKTLLAAHP